MRIYRPARYFEKGVPSPSGVWWVDYRINGVRKRQSLKTKERRAAELKAAEIVRRAELQAAGITDPFEDQRARPVEEHVEDFLTALRAKNRAPKYVADRETCLTEFMERFNPKGLGALDAGRASAWLVELAARGLSARSVNRRVAALKQFGRWLHVSHRWTHDAFSTLTPLNEDADRRRVRRALRPDEVERLLAAAEARPLADAESIRIHAGVTVKERKRLKLLGRTRRLTYSLALGTGLRRGEVQRLSWRDLDLDDGWVHVPAKSAKSRRDQSVPLREDLVEALRRHRKRVGERDGGDLVIPSGSFPNSRTFNADVDFAGIEREDADGRRVDFHCLRVTFVSRLAASGAHPRVAQALARHSSIELTMKVYTDLAVLDLRGATEAAGRVGSGSGRQRAG